MLGANLLAENVKSSSVYRQSRIVRLLLSQDSVSMRGLFSQRRNIAALLKFTGALTNATINFEMIPVGEASTFMAVLESLRDGIHIESFAYNRRNLTIYGGAKTPESYRAFLGALRETDYFHHVSERSCNVGQAAIRFELECMARPVGTQN